MAGDANIERFVSQEDRPDSEEKCFQKYANLPDQDSSLCPPAWDTMFCWPPTKAGSTVSLPCRAIFPGMFVEENTHSNHVAEAYRTCNEDGFWSNDSKTNYTECMELEIKPDPPISPLTIIYVISICSIISLVSLLISLFIFCYFKTLQCSRIRVHRNLVLSLILHAIMMLALSLPGIFASVDTLKETDWLCKAVVVLKMYAAMTCIHWMFVEGLLLHSSITVSVFQREPPFTLYYCVGWGIPFLCVGSWLLIMCFVSNSPCWKGYGRSPYVWFITGPMILALGVNAVFLVNIIRILVTKLRSSVSIETKQVKKAMKATALLFPLLGITHLIFCINPRDDGDQENIYMLVNAFLQSSQGLFVAVLYCFLNSEVQSVLSSAYTRYALRRDPRRSTRSSRGSRMFASTTSTSLSPEVLPNGSAGLPPKAKVRFALLHKKSTTLTIPLKALPEEDLKKETAYVD